MTPNSVVTVQTPKHNAVQILPADTTALKDLVPVGTANKPRKVVGLVAATDETAARVIQVWHLKGGTAYLLGSISVPAASGNDGALPSVDLLGLISGLPIDNDGQRYLLVEDPDKIQVKSTAAITAAKTMHVNCYLGEF